MRAGVLSQYSLFMTAAAKMVSHPPLPLVLRILDQLSGQIEKDVAGAGSCGGSGGS